MTDSSHSELWALVDWDNTVRPGFLLIDWVHALSQQGCATVREVQKVDDAYSSLRHGVATYSDFAESIISIYRSIEQRMTKRDLERLASDFVNSDEEFLVPNSIRRDSV